MGEHNIHYKKNMENIHKYLLSQQYVDNIFADVNNVVLKGEQGCLICRNGDHTYLQCKEYSIFLELLYRIFGVNFSEKKINRQELKDIAIYLYKLQTEENRITYFDYCMCITVLQCINRID